MKYIFVLAFLLLSIKTFSQLPTNKYKYIIVPTKYTFTSEPNQFQINVLTRVLLKETEFEIVMSEGEKFPQELAENQCLGLKANVIKDGGLFTTTLRFELKNCFGNMVFESAGTSREKAFKEAYHECLKQAIHEFQVVSKQYLKYDGEEEEQTIEVKAEIESKTFSEKAIQYENNERDFWLVKQNDDYILYLDQGKTVYATLEKADRGTFAFDSEDIDGAAYFDANGNLIVEYLAKDKDAVQKLIFKKQ
jgi:hypothetical protein